MGIGRGVQPCASVGMARAATPGRQGGDHAGGSEAKRCVPCVHPPDEEGQAQAERLLPRIEPTSAAWTTFMNPARNAKMPRTARAGCRARTAGRRSPRAEALAQLLGRLAHQRRQERQRHTSASEAQHRASLNHRQGAGHGAANGSRHNSEPFRSAKHAASLFITGVGRRPSQCWPLFRLGGALKEGGAPAIRFGKPGGSIEGLPSRGGNQGD